MASRISDGDRHDYITLLLVIPSGIASVFVGRLFGYEQDITDFIVGSLGCILGLFVNPDLDLVGISNAESNLLKLPLAGPIAMGLWIAVWTPYAKYIIRRHRSFWSHAPIIGTVIRMFYLYLVYVILGIVWSLVSKESFSPWWNFNIVFLLFIGMSIADTGHWVRDVMPRRRYE